LVRLLPEEDGGICGEFVHRVDNAAGSTIPRNAVEKALGKTKERAEILPELCVFR
jgi:hypothetical protein